MFVLAFAVVFTTSLSISAVSFLLSLVLLYLYYLSYLICFNFIY